MDSPNVQLARDAIAAWNRREPDLWVRYAAPDFEWVPAGPAAVETDVYRGHAEAGAGVTTAFETFELFEFEGDDVRDLDDGALWLGRLRTRGGASGVELEREFALRFTVSGNRFTRVRGYPSQDEALRAAGLDARG
jgi:ketosteroid isomerase-like protein